MLVKINNKEYAALETLVKQYGINLNALIAIAKSKGMTYIHSDETHIIIADESSIVSSLTEIENEVSPTVKIAIKHLVSKMSRRIP